MPQYKGDLKYPKPPRAHDLAEVVGAHGRISYICLACDTYVDPKDVEAHRARFEPEAAS
ncbi:MAG TPA: hypothetical protein VLA89_15215 [Gemmatimonadales bacterium]|nr:hypothetical protein [Gemmatimonadales bacterium]